MSAASQQRCEVCGRVDYDCVCDEPNDASPTWWQERCATLAFKNQQLRILLEAEGDTEIGRLRGLVDACAIYLKEDETPAQRIERERANTDAVLKLLLKEKREIERLRQIIHDLDEHEGAEGWSEELRKRIREALGE